jgi:hypothetical protein
MAEIWNQQKLHRALSGMVKRFGVDMDKKIFGELSKIEGILQNQAILEKRLEVVENQLNSEPTAPVKRGPGRPPKTE